MFDLQPLKSLLKSNSNDWLHVCFLFQKGRKQNISPRPGNEPGSPAIHMERGRLLTGGYTDHYTNEEHIRTPNRTLYNHVEPKPQNQKVWGFILVFEMTTAVDYSRY